MIRTDPKACSGTEKAASIMLPFVVLGWLVLLWA
ncbi:hypothetical protein DYI21_07270 [Thalassospira tepidiphila]|nr:hypothetical protein [Thalassospira tepidiphila]